MRINDTKGINKYLQVQKKGKIKTTKTEKIKKTTNVDISKLGKEMANKITESNDDVFSNKVEEIRKSVMEGNYKVSSEDIANKIVDKMVTQKGNDE